MQYFAFTHNLNTAETGEYLNVEWESLRGISRLSDISLQFRDAITLHAICNLNMYVMKFDSSSSPLYPIHPLHSRCCVVVVSSRPKNQTRQSLAGRWFSPALRIRPRSLQSSRSCSSVSVARIAVGSVVFSR